MKTLLKILVGMAYVILILGACLLALYLLSKVIFYAIDYSPLLGGALIVLFFVAFSLVGGLGKTREYFPGIKTFLKVSNGKEKDVLHKKYKK